MKKSLLLLLILSTTFFGFGQTYLNTQKTLADAIAVKNALDILTHGGSNPSILPYAEKITGNLKIIGELETGFYHYAYPITLMIDDENKKEIKQIEKELTATMKEVKGLVEIAINQFEIDRYPILQSLLSENPGDYYSAINPAFSYNLSNHPLRLKIEEICLQDFPFNEMASGDTALWNMGSFCPELKRIYLFGAELTTQDLTKLDLNGIQNLEVLDLSENKITMLSEGFNNNNHLIYLSLAKNDLTSIGDTFKSWSNLRYLNLKGNKIPAEEIKRIQKVLPLVKILY
jgi:hypothetical protein